MSALGVPIDSQRPTPGWRDDSSQGPSLHGVGDLPLRTVQLNLVHLLTLDDVLDAATCSAFAATWQLMANVAPTEFARATAVRRRSGWMGVRPAATRGELALAPAVTTPAAEVSVAGPVGSFGEVSALVLAGLERDALPAGFDVVHFTRGAVDEAFAGLDADRQ